MGLRLCSLRSTAIKHHARQITADGIRFQELPLGRIFLTFLLFPCFLGAVCSFSSASMCLHFSSRPANSRPLTRVGPEDTLHCKPWLPRATAVRVSIDKLAQFSFSDSKTTTIDAAQLGIFQHDGPHSPPCGQSTDDSCDTNSWSIPNTDEECESLGQFKSNSELNLASMLPRSPALVSDTELHGAEPDRVAVWLQQLPSANIIHCAGDQTGASAHTRTSNFNSIATGDAGPLVEDLRTFHPPTPRTENLAATT
jgi:hypothetical protein